VFVTEKFGWNRYSSFDNMQVLLFYELGMTMLIQARKREFEDLTPNEHRLIVKPKGTCLRGNTSYDVFIVKIGLPVRARREPKWNQFLLVVKSHRCKRANMEILCANSTHRR